MLLDVARRVSAREFEALGPNLISQVTADLERQLTTLGVDDRPRSIRRYGRWTGIDESLRAVGEEVEYRMQALVTLSDPATALPGELCLARTEETGWQQVSIPTLDGLALLWKRT